MTSCNCFETSCNHSEGLIVLRECCSLIRPSCECQTSDYFIFNCSVNVCIFSWYVLAMNAKHLVMPCCFTHVHVTGVFMCPCHESVRSCRVLLLCEYVPVCTVSVCPCCSANKCQCVLYHYVLVVLRTSASVHSTSIFLLFCEHVPVCTVPVYSCCSVNIGQCVLYQYFLVRNV